MIAILARLTRSNNLEELGQKIQKLGAPISNICYLGIGVLCGMLASSIALQPPTYGLQYVVDVALVTTALIAAAFPLVLAPLYLGLYMYVWCHYRRAKRANALDAPIRK